MSANHSTTKLATPTKRDFEAVLTASESNIYQTHLVIPSEIASAFAAEKIKRVVATLHTRNGSHEYQCGLIPRGKGKVVIMVNKDIRTKYNIAEGEKVQVVLCNDESEYGLEMPEELAELMRQDEEGSHFFHALTEGKQRTLIYIVSSMKNSERRIERAITIIRHLKEFGGKVDYKRLYGDLKISKRFED